MENNNYPDSLEQITNDNKFFAIYDPFLLRKLDKNIKIMFNYEKLGNKYTLFSVGVDGEPHTSDDIYPTLPDSNGLQYGWIRK